MNSDDQFSQNIVANLPSLRGLSLQLARNSAMAEDLVQDTMVRALTYRSQFQPGTNLRGWLSTILRNRYLNELRRSRYKVEVQVDVERASGSMSGGQEERLQLRDMERGLAKLSQPQREALRLVTMDGLSYEDAAKVAGCETGTIKSRVSRARLQLQAA